MNLAYKYRIYPNRTQTEALEHALYLGRNIYNDSMRIREETYKRSRIILSAIDMRDNWTGQKGRALRNEPGFEELQHLPASTIDRLMRRLDQAYKNFRGRYKKYLAGELKLPPPRKEAQQGLSFKRRCWLAAGYPRYKGKDHFRSLDYVDPKLDAVRERIRLQNIGDVRIVLHRPLPEGAKIKNSVITKESESMWFISLQLEFESRPLPSPMFEGAVGIDVGLHYVIATSDGKPPQEHPHLYIETLREQYLLQRKLDRQQRRGHPQYYPELDERGWGKGTLQKGGIPQNEKSTRLKETERLLAAINARVKRQREYFWNDITDKLTRNYSYIALEDLSLDFMQQNKRLSKLVHDASIGRFWQLLKFKANERGVHLEWVTPQYTSQTCPVCGCVAPENRLTQAKFICIDCGHKANADVNAARNILKRALEQREFRASNGQMQIWRGLEAL